MIYTASMQTLGISNTPKSESRLRSLFWPSIQNSSDVDYLGAQGFWVCAGVAVFSFIIGALTGHALLGAAVLIFYFLGGMGVRERSRYAAAMVFAMFATDAVLAGPSAIRIILAALLLANFRATWISAVWERGAGAPVVAPRLAETWTDKLADQLPMQIWPKARIPFYVYSAGYAALELLGVAAFLGFRPR